MDRNYYIQLAQDGLCMPIGADLILHQHEDFADILIDGERLGRVIEETAYYFGTPLAIPHMDLELEKKELLGMLGVAPEKTDTFHFDEAPTVEAFAKVKTALEQGVSKAIRAQVNAVRYISQSAELLPIGMSIGPFSLMTHLVADPITPVCMAGMGITAEEDPDVQLVTDVLELGMLVILHTIKEQIAAGAKAIFIAEPAANIVYFSPNQIEEGSDIFDRFVLQYHKAIRALLAENDVDLIFHCCGELTDNMVTKFASLDPAILSLGSSRKLWEDAEIVPKTTVLYGNLPSKKFYSDDLITLEDITRQGSNLVNKMRDAGHPFILGTECDVLSVSGAHDKILHKAAAITGCCCGLSDLKRLPEQEESAITVG